MLRLADRRQHPRHHGGVDSPEEVALVLGRIRAPVECAVPGDRIVSGCDVRAVQGIGVGQEVAEFGERIAAHAGDGCPASAVLAHEVLNHVQIEPVLEIEDVVRDTQRRRDVAGVVDGIQRAAGPIGDLFAVAEELHGGPHHVISLLNQSGSGNGAVHSA